MSVSKRAIKMPPRLLPGDTVGIIAPAGAVERAALELGILRLKEMGHPAVFLDSIYERDQYFAGSVDRRVNETHEMFKRDDVKGIISARGGYGCSQLLPYLDLSLIREHHKPLIGYSDLTTLHSWLNDNGLGAFHGPMVSKDFARPDGVDCESWRRVLAGEGHAIEVAGESAQVVVGGTGSGRLYGGCLSLLVESLGTPYAIAPADSILFIEDIGVWPYQVDRMLTHLRLSGKLDRVRGIIFGDMARCTQDELPEYTVGLIAKRIFGDLGVPIVVGLRSGHVEHHNITLPMGSEIGLVTHDNGFTLTVQSWSAN